MSEIKDHALFLDNVLKDFTVNHMKKKTVLKGFVIFFLFILVLLILTIFSISIHIWWKGRDIK